MIPVTIRQLQYYAAAYEEGSFTRAAEREHCSQPALSEQIGNLEKILNRTLLERAASGIRPTAEGRRFYRHAVAILRSVNQAQIDMAEVSGQVAGQVRAGLIPSVVRGLLPSFLPKFVAAYPMIDLRIIQGFSDTLAEAVLAQAVEFAVVLEPPRHDGIEISRFLDDSMVLISSPALGLERGAPLRLPQLEPLNLVVPSPNHTLRKNIERGIWTREIRVSRILEMDSVHGMIDFVAESDWATILPMTAVACDVDSPRLCINPIIEPRLTADLYLINLTRNPLTATARLFADELQRQGGGIGRVAPD